MTTRQERDGQSNRTEESVGGEESAESGKEGVRLRSPERIRVGGVGETRGDNAGGEQDRRVRWWTG